MLGELSTSQLVPIAATPRLEPSSASSTVDVEVQPESVRSLGTTGWIPEYFECLGQFSGDRDEREPCIISCGELSTAYEVSCRVTEGDLEDEAMEGRLEQALQCEYGLGIAAVSKTFAPELDVENFDALVRAFAAGVCQLTEGVGKKAGSGSVKRQKVDGVVRRAMGTVGSWQAMRVICQAGNQAGNSSQNDVRSVLRQRDAGGPWDKCSSDGLGLELLESSDDEDGLGLTEHLLELPDLHYILGTVATKKENGMLQLPVGSSNLAADEWKVELVRTNDDGSASLLNIQRGPVVVQLSAFETLTHHEAQLIGAPERSNLYGSTSVTSVSSFTSQVSNPGGIAGILPDSSDLSVGDRVEGRFGGFHQWFPGTIIALNQDSTLAINYDDGDEEAAVPRLRVRLEGQKQPREIPVGSTVDVKGKGKQYKMGRVLQHQSDGNLYTVEYEKDGGLVTEVPRKAILSQYGWPPDHPKNITDAKEPPQVAAEDGAALHRYSRLSKGSSTSLPEGIAAMRPSQDGESNETGRPPQRTTAPATAPATTRLLQAKHGSDDNQRNSHHDSSSCDSSSIKHVGTAAASAYKQAVSSGNTASAASIGSAHSGVPAPQDDALKVGAAIQARHGSRSQWFAGVIQAVSDDGSFAIRYDDGDEEAAVPRLRVRLEGQKQPREIPVGSTVDVKGKGKQYKMGRVLQHQSEGNLYTVEYEKDGGLVTEVPRAAIIAMHGWPPGHPKDAPSQPSGSLEGQSHQDTSQQGVLQQPQDTSDTSGSGVKKLNLDRKIGTSSSGSDGETELSIGQKVEARHGGKALWFVGMVTAVNANGTVDIAYEDGDRETAVPRIRVRLEGQKQPREIPVGSIIDLRSKGQQLRLGRILQHFPQGNLYTVEYIEGAGIVKEVPRKAIMALHRWPQASKTHDGIPFSRSRGSTGSIGSIGSTGSIETEASVESAGNAITTVHHSSPNLSSLNKENATSAAATPRTTEAKTSQKDSQKGAQGCSSNTSIASATNTASVASLQPSSSRSLSIQSGVPSTVADLSVGDRVEGRFGGFHQWFPGTIIALNQDGTLAINYDDGDEEAAVPRLRVRS
ncbi:unnamed protein product [Chrysoparadoxa australica]